MADKHPTVALLDRLQQRSEEGRLKWEVATHENTFQAAFPAYSVQISESGPTNDPDYILRIYGPEGELVEEIGTGELSQLLDSPYFAAQRLRELYVSARRSARGADKAVKSILDALGPDDDDIPF